MKCPACARKLQEMEIENVTIDVCKDGCGGMWFDRFELSKVDEAREAAGEALLEIPVDESIRVDHEKRRNCPRCENMIMMRHFFSPRQTIEVDECPQCAGIWLDAGELRNIRTEFESEEQRREAAREAFSKFFDGSLDNLRAETEQETEKIRKIGGLFKFICPSYYIPGKQKWGAF